VVAPASSLRARSGRSAYHQCGHGSHFGSKKHADNRRISAKLTRGWRNSCSSREPDEYPMLTRRHHLLAAPPADGDRHADAARACTAAADLAIAMTWQTSPPPTARPTRPTEGIRFMGYTLYDPLITWDLSSEPLPDKQCLAWRPSGIRTQPNRRVDLRGREGREVPLRLDLQRRRGSSASTACSTRNHHPSTASAPKC